MLDGDVFALRRAAGRSGPGEALWGFHRAVLWSEMGRGHGGGRMYGADPDMSRSALSRLGESVAGR